MNVPYLIKQSLCDALKKEYSLKISPEDIYLEHPANNIWGDYASNVCFTVTKELNHSPQEIAKKVLYRLQDLDFFNKVGDQNIKIFKKIDSAGGGFINFTLSEEFLVSGATKMYSKTQISQQLAKKNPLSNQKVLIEFTDPNPFKVFHIGHLMSNAIGESLSRIFEFLGSDLKRVNYQGDVGLHVAKFVWGVFKNLNGGDISDLSKLSLQKRVEFLGKAYSVGAKAYKNDDKEVNEEIKYLNTLIYKIAQEILIKKQGWEPVINYDQYIKNKIDKYSYKEVKKIYKLGKKWSFESFEEVYKRLGTKFDSYYFESKAGEYGLKIVQNNMKGSDNKGVFEEDQGAVIFKADNYGLHNRVFINSYGLPTYEAKDLGLSILKNEDFKYDKSYIVTANEINEYFKVILKALSIIKPDLAEKTTHIGHGMMKLKTGKMSSRTGDVISGVDLLDDTLNSVLDQMKESNTELPDKKRYQVADKLAVGAVKYSILKQSPGKDIIYDKKQLISITGNTGPYLQYTHARANSVLENTSNWDYDLDLIIYQLEKEEIVLNKKEVDLLRYINRFYGEIERSAEDLSPNIICEYLHNVAQKFNSFYNDIPILSADTDVQRNLRLQITKKTKSILKIGLWLLGIEAPQRV